MPTPSWTYNRVHKLRRLIEERYSAGEAAVELRVTRSAALGKAMALGLHFQSAPVRLLVEMPSTEPAKPSAVDLSIWRKINEPPIPLPDDLRSIETDAEHLPFCDTDAGCSWPMSPINEPGSARMPVCCADTVDGSPYCVDHQRLSLKRYATA